MLYNWDDNQKSINDGLVTGFMPLGGIVGAAFAGVISGKLGRRLSFIVLDGIAIASSGILMIKGFAPLLIGRFIAGISIGGNSAIVPLYINEVAPQELAGSLGSMT
jgi:major inositol transporter-like SP family MFS transporter